MNAADEAIAKIMPHIVRPTEPEEVGTEIVHTHPWHYDYAIVRMHKKTGEQARILVSSTSGLLRTLNESDWSPLP